MTSWRADRLSAALDERGYRGIGRPLTLLERTGSTNDDARRIAAEGAPHGSTIIADTQHAGRGRGDRGWHSPPGCNLYLSTVLRLTLAPEAFAPLALAVGVAVARASDELVGSSSSVKWPNDVYLDERKLAGVLVEATTRSEDTLLIAGIGVNVNARDLPDGFAVPATSLALAAGRDVDRLEAAAVLLHHLGDVLEGYVTDGLASVLGDLRDRDFLASRRVRVGDVVGKASGIDDAGRLLVVDDAGERHPIGSGEVTWRGVS